MTVHVALICSAQTVPTSPRPWRDRPIRSWDLAFADPDGLPSRRASALSVSIAARSWQVEERAQDSLLNLPPGNWHALVPYLMSRSVERGARRAEETRKAALTMSEADVRLTMSEAVAVRQKWAARYQHAAVETELSAMPDVIGKGDYE